MKRLLKCLKGLLVVALIVGIFVIGINVWMIHSTQSAIYTLDEADQLTGNCILVLGCGVRSDGKPSHMLQDRLDVAIAAYQKGLAPKLLMSGDHGREHYDEVNAMKDYAISKGVPSEDIFMDHAGFSTYESMHRARNVFQCERVIIVTQNYHLYRAVHNARAFKMEAVGISSDLRSYARQTYFDIREAAARSRTGRGALRRFRPPIWAKRSPSSEMGTSRMTGENDTALQRQRGSPLPGRG